MTTKILKNEFPNQNYNNIVLIKLDKIYNRKKKNSENNLL